MINLTKILLFAFLIYSVYSVPVVKQDTLLKELKKGVTNQLLNDEQGVKAAGLEGEKSEVEQQLAAEALKAKADKQLAEKDVKAEQQLSDDKEESEAQQLVGGKKVKVVKTRDAKDEQEQQQEAEQQVSEDKDDQEQQQQLSEDKEESEAEQLVAGKKVKVVKTRDAKDEQEQQQEAEQQVSEDKDDQEQEQQQQLSDDKEESEAQQLVAGKKVKVVKTRDAKDEQDQQEAEQQVSEDKEDQEQQQQVADKKSKSEQQLSEDEQDSEAQQLIAKTPNRKSMKAIKTRDAKDQQEQQEEAEQQVSEDKDDQEQQQQVSEDKDESEAEQLVAGKKVKVVKTRDAKDEQEQQQEAEQQVSEDKDDQEQQQQASEDKDESEAEQLVGDKKLKTRDAKDQEDAEQQLADEQQEQQAQLNQLRKVRELLEQEQQEPEAEALIHDHTDIETEKKNPCERKHFKYYQPHPTDNTKYYQCDPWGSFVVHTCDKDTIWDRWTLTCSKSEDVRNLTAIIPGIKRMSIFNCTVEDSACLNGGVCVKEGHHFSCECVGNFTGDLCETKVTEGDMFGELISGNFSLKEYVAKLLKETTDMDVSYYEQYKTVLDEATYSKLMSYLTKYKKGIVRYDILVNSLVEDVLTDIYPDADFLRSFNISSQNIIATVRLIPNLLSYAKYSSDRYQEVFVQYQSVLGQLWGFLNATCPNISTEAIVYNKLTQLFLNDTTTSTLKNFDFKNTTTKVSGRKFFRDVLKTEKIVKDTIKADYDVTLEKTTKLYKLLVTFQKAVAQEFKTDPEFVHKTVAETNLPGSVEIVKLFDEIQTTNIEIWDSLVSYGFWYLTNMFTAPAAVAAVATNAV